MSKKLIILCVVIAGILLFWFYRQGQLGTILPWIIILICPLMHLFMMKSMHNQKDGEQKNGSDKNNTNCH